VDCLGGLVADDTPVVINGVSYVPTSHTATLNVNSGAALPGGRYRLFVCGTTSVEDLGGNKLNGGLSDAQATFVVAGQPTNLPTKGSRRNLSGNGFPASLPTTGFPTGKVTVLPHQPAQLAYQDLGSLWLEMPSLNVRANIVGVPQSDDAWDITWLGTDAGWLNSTAFPTWIGNSVITGHVYDSDGLPGPFVNIKDLKYGDQIIVHLYGEKYIFEVRSSSVVLPSSTDFAFEHLYGHAYLTLITCQSYQALSDSYLFRRIVRAVLVDMQSE
jgi:LPXTG-site transpeptidase (sortase) family protein